MKTQYIHTLPKDWIPAAEVFAALGDSTRQKILLLFEKNEELSIKNIVEAFSLSRTSITYHLGVLESEGVLQVRRCGKTALYSLKPQLVLEAVNRLRDYILLEFEPRLAIVGEEK